MCEMCVAAPETLHCSCVMNDVIAAVPTTISKQCERGRATRETDLRCETTRCGTVPNKIGMI